MKVFIFLLLIAGVFSCRLFYQTPPDEEALVGNSSDSRIYQLEDVLIANVRDSVAVGQAVDSARPTISSVDISTQKKNRFIPFDISDAISLVGSFSIVSLTLENTVEPVFSVSPPPQSSEPMITLPPTIFIHITDDGDLYICYDSFVFVPNVGNDGEGANFQLKKVLPDNTIQIIWPSDPYLNVGPLVSIPPENKMHSFINDNYLYFAVGNDLYRYSFVTQESILYSHPQSPEFSLSAFNINQKDEVLIEWHSVDSIVFDLYDAPNIKKTFFVEYSNESINYYPHTDGIDTVACLDFFYCLFLRGLRDFRPELGIWSGLWPGLYTVASTSDGFEYHRVLGNVIGANESLFWRWGAAWERGAAIIVDIDQDDEYEWAETVLTDSIVDVDRVFGQIHSFYASGFNPKPGTYEYIENTDNFLDIVDQITSGVNFGSQIEFLDRYFDGVRLDEASYGLIRSISSMHVFDGSLYGVAYYDNQIHVMKIRNSNNKNDFILLAVNTRSTDKIPGRTTGASLSFQDNYLYFKFPFPSEGISEHYIGRIEITAGDIEYFTDYFDRHIRVNTFDVSSDNNTLYFSGFYTDTGEYVNGELDLVTKAFTAAPNGFTVRDIAAY